MPVTFDATSTSNTSGATSLTFSHTCTGTNLVLIVGCTTNGNVDVTGVTYAGASLTAIQTGSATGGGGPFSRSELFGKIGPATGANNIVVTVASSTGIRAGGISVTNADQTTGWHNPATANDDLDAQTATPSVAVTSAAGELVVDVMTCGVNASSNPTATVGASQTQRWNGTSAADQVRGCGSHEAGAASVTMSWTLSSSELWSICGVSIIEAAAGATPAGQLLTMGIGA